MTTPIDLRSDTVTRPPPAMRAAMAAAPVGDDQYGEDPTVNALQERVAALLGKEAALCLPCGTMANQVALRVLTRPGDDVLVSRESHAVWHETGGSAANAGVQFTEIGARGVFTADEFLAAVKPRGHVIYPPTTLVEVENTHNRAGGVVFPQDEVERVCAAARERGMATLPRRRAAVERRGRDRPRPRPSSRRRSTSWPWRCRRVSARRADRCSPARATLIASALATGACSAARCARSGSSPPPALYALDHHLARLADDHANARLFAERLAKSPRILLDLATVQTNIVVFAWRRTRRTPRRWSRAARERACSVFAFGPRTIRAVTHLDVVARAVRRSSPDLGAVRRGPAGPLLGLNRAASAWPQASRAARLRSCSFR